LIAQAMGDKDLSISTAKQKSQISLVAIVGKFRDAEISHSKSIPERLLD
jgi:hypothetical protein